MATIKERILKFCKVERRTKNADSLIYGKRTFQMNSLFENLSEEDIGKIFKDKDLGIGAFVKQAEADEKTRVEKTAAKKKSTVSSKPCECGCGEMTRKGSKFRQGHDMKLKSKLIKAAAGGDKKAMKELESRGWTKAAESAVKLAGKMAKKATAKAVKSKPTKKTKKTAKKKS